MKKWICFMMTAVLCATLLTACGKDNGQQSSTAAQAQTEDNNTVLVPAAEEETDVEDAETEEQQTADTTDEQQAAGADEEQGGKVLVVYYSASGNTKAVGDVIAQHTGGDIFEIIPVEEYTAEDLDWTKDGSRVNREHDDESLQDIELVSTTVDNFDSYDTVFIGYPIWWHEAAWVVDHFVKDNDFTGKTVIPFCTSSSSGLGESGKNLAAMAGTGNWEEGQRFSGNADESEVIEWLEGLGF